MALELLYAGTRNSVLALDADAFSRVNYLTSKANLTARIAATAPLGVLAGSVACLKGEGLAGAPVYPLAATGPEPVGLFLNNAAGNPYENTPAVSSGKVTVVMGMATVKTDLYETKDTANAALTYAVGDKLYCSDFGLLTKEAPTAGNKFNAREVGVVWQAPTGSDPFMIVQLKV